MKAHFNLIKEDRKALVKALVKITGHEADYQGAPSFAFAVGGYVVDRAGTVDFGGEDRDTVFGLLGQLFKDGFVYEGDVEEDSALAESGDTPADGDAEHCETAPDGDSGRLSISMPMFAIDTPLFNVEKLIAAKAWILKKMAGTDSLPIERDERHLRFPWFKPDASAEEVEAYTHLIVRLCETAIMKQRVTASERQLGDGDNEKFKARCFLLSIGFIGDEYKQARKVLLSPFSGSGSHRAGDGKKAAPTGATATDSGGDSAAGVAVHEGTEPAQNAENASAPLRCGECDHHCYFTEGLLRTSAGDIVDTSSRTPDKYTHYCLNTPRGFRKIKHANDWSGCETAPKWCPLNAAKTAGSGGESAEAVHAREDGSEAEDAPTGGGNGAYCDCLACGNSMSEPAAEGEGSDKLFCVVKQAYVSDNGFCDEFNS
jgi:hypothetical protein